MIVSFILYLLLCFFSYVESSRTWHSPGRIVGGEPANIEDFPYQLSLEAFSGHGYRHTCGASIIHHTWALTAAHCVEMYPKEYLRLRSGSSYRMRGGQLYYVAMIIIHPNYKSDWSKPLDYDISVIKVFTPFQYSGVAQKIVMASATPPSGIRAVVSGWGGLNYEPQFPDQLQQLTVYTMGYRECKHSHSVFYYNLTPRMLCAGFPAGGKNFYLGDSGGPLVTNNTQVGIVSFMSGHDFEYYPGVYTDVSKMRPWVISVIGED